MKLLTDMNLSPRWIELFEEAAFAAVHWSMIGDVTAPDAEIMAYAAANDCVVVTNDLDFGTILASSRGVKPSVIQLRADDVRPEAAGPVVLAALWQCGDDIAAGALLTVDAARFRLTLLPLHR